MPSRIAKNVNLSRGQYDRLVSVQRAIAAKSGHQIHLTSLIRRGIELLIAEVEQQSRSSFVLRIPNDRRAGQFGPDPDKPASEPPISSARNDQLLRELNRRLHQEHLSPERVRRAIPGQLAAA